jgi:hypothetical protein
MPYPRRFCRLLHQGSRILSRSRRFRLCTSWRAQQLISYNMDCTLRKASRRLPSGEGTGTKMFYPFPALNQRMSFFFLLSEVVRLTLCLQQAECSSGIGCRHTLVLFTLAGRIESFKLDQALVVSSGHGTRSSRDIRGAASTAEAAKAKRAEVTKPGSASSPCSARPIVSSISWVKSFFQHA